MLDITHKLDFDKKVIYVFFNTGFEYRATLEYLDELERKYGIKIERYRAKKPIPIACKEKGVPFLSKYVSEMIYRLQKNGFKWEDKSYDELLKEYPNCKCSLKWWTNQHVREDGKTSSFNIDRDPYLKEFMIENPPEFRISSKCCDYAKKQTAKDIVKFYNADLQLIGIRKSEGGIRKARYKSCFSPGSDVDSYRPIFWFTNDVKKRYKEKYGVSSSECYTEYGLTRTGCVGCPFNNDFENELRVIEKNEPNLRKAVEKVFGKSYEYTRAFRDYQRKKGVKV